MLHECDGVTRHVTLAPGVTIDFFLFFSIKVNILSENCILNYILDYSLL